MFLCGVSQCNVQYNVVELHFVLSLSSHMYFIADEFASNKVIYMFIKKNVLAEIARSTLCGLYCDV